MEEDRRRTWFLPSNETGQLQTVEELLTQVMVAQRKALGPGHFDTLFTGRDSSINLMKQGCHLEADGVGYIAKASEASRSQTPWSVVIRMHTDRVFEQPR